MITKIARYKIKPEELESIIKAIKIFVRAVHINESQTMYHAYRKGDTMEFIHFMQFPDTDAEQKHQNASYTKAFTEIIYPRCIHEPRFTDLSEIK